MESSASDVEGSSSKRMRHSQIFNRTSARRMEKSKRKWAVFDFHGEKQTGMLTVPASWINKNKQTGVQKGRHTCLWPEEGTRDLAVIKSLIKECSTPKLSWVKLPGSLKGFFENLREAEEYIVEKLGTNNSSGSSTKDYRSDLQQRILEKLQKEAAAADRIKKTTVCVNLPSTSISATKNADAEITGEESAPPCEPQTISAREFTQLFNMVRDNKQLLLQIQKNLAEQNATLHHEMEHMKKTLADHGATLHHEMEDMKKNVADQSALQQQQLLKELQKRTPVGQVESTEPIENPMDVLKSFGFKANTLNELLDAEVQFAYGPDCKKNMSKLLRVLFALGPKDPKQKPLSIVRATMKRLADESTWQFVSAMGRSGTKKISMQKMMPSIMDAVCLTAMKIIDCDFKETNTSISNFLKSCAHRAASKKVDANSDNNIGRVASPNNTSVTSQSMLINYHSSSSNTSLSTDEEQTD